MYINWRSRTNGQQSDVSLFSPRVSACFRVFHLAQKGMPQIWRQSPSIPWWVQYLKCRLKIWDTKIRWSMWIRYDQSIDFWSSLSPFCPHGSMVRSPLGTSYTGANHPGSSRSAWVAEDVLNYCLALFGKGKLFINVHNHTGRNNGQRWEPKTNRFEVCNCSTGAMFTIVTSICWNVGLLGYFGRVGAPTWEC